MEKCQRAEYPSSLPRKNIYFDAMRLKIDGLEYIYTHECEESERGRNLTRSEIHSFLVDCLIEAYELKNIRCIRHDKDFNSGADFSFTKLGKTYCCKVKYIRNNDNALADIQRMDEPDYNPQLKRGFEEHGVIPRIYYVEVQCISDEEDRFVAGGEYLMEFHPVQWLKSEKPTSAKDISDVKLIKGYAKAWETGDSKFLEDYISPYFHASSDLSFEQVTSKTEYIAHFKAQQKRWHDIGAIVSTELVRDEESCETGLFIKVNGKALGFVIINCKDFRISNTHTKKIPVSHSTWNPCVELYQTHGNHHAPLLDDDELLPYLTTSLKKKPSFSYKVVTNVNLDEDTDFDTTVCSFKIGDPNIDKAFYIALLAENREGKTNQFVSAYPYLEGKPTLVKILDILEWDNRIEATIKCVYEFDGEGFEFHFFATDYFANKNLYRIGNTIEIALAASSGDARVASKGIKFDGQKAIDFLSKLGVIPTYDENGEVMPVNLSTEKLIAFFVHDKKCPEEAEFQSPTEYYHDDFCFFNYNRPIRKRLITIDNNTQLKVPLYFRADFDIKDGDSLTGILWLSGRLAHPIAVDNRSSIKWALEAVKFARAADFIIDYINLNGIRTEYELDTIAEKFEKIELYSGFKLFCAKVGTAEEYYYKFYIARPFKFFEKTRLPDGRYICTIEENDHPEGIVQDTYVSTIPNVLDRIAVRFNSSLAIFEAFLLHISEHLLPRRGKYFENRQYYFSSKQIESNTIIKNSDYSWFDLQPLVHFNSQCSGTIVIHYWDDSYGLVRELYTFVNDEGHIQIQLDSTFILIEYRQEESDLLFRD